VTSILKPLSQFLKIVDLAIEHNSYRAIFVEDWLMAAFQIDDTQPPHPQSKRSTAEIPLVIGPAMKHRRRHAPNERSRVSRTRPINCSANAAHDVAEEDAV